MTKNNSKETSKIQSYIIYIMPILFVGLAFVISKYCFQLMMIQGESMEPTYHNLQIVILDKRQPTEYQVGDVIAFSCDELNSNLVKRIDRVQFVEETGELCYYVLGDNRDFSVDSRDERVGWIYGDQIFGKVIFPNSDGR